MVKFKIIVSDPEHGKSRVVELEGTKAIPLLGIKMGDIIDGSILGIAGLKLSITGGSDRDGFPMNASIHGGVRKSIIVSKGIGFHPHREGERRRKTFRGNVITDDITQINMKISDKSKKMKAGKSKTEKKKKAFSSKPANPIDAP